MIVLYEMSDFGCDLSLIPYVTPSHNSWLEGGQGEPFIVVVVVWIISQKTLHQAFFRSEAL